MRTERRAMIERLTRAGITLSASLDVPGGCETAPLNADQALAYMADPVAFSARYFGLCVAEYHAWVSCEGVPRCAAITKLGSRCGNPARGATPLSAEAWGERPDGFCALHQP